MSAFISFHVAHGRESDQVICEMKRMPSKISFSTSFSVWKYELSGQMDTFAPVSLS